MGPPLTTALLTRCSRSWEALIEDWDLHGRHRDAVGFWQRCCASDSSVGAPSRIEITRQVECLGCITRKTMPGIISYNISAAASDLSDSLDAAFSCQGEIDDNCSNCGGEIATVLSESINLPTFWPFR